MLHDPMVLNLYLGNIGTMVSKVMHGLVSAVVWELLALLETLSPQAHI